MVGKDKNVRRDRVELGIVGHQEYKLLIKTKLFIPSSLDCS